MLYFNKVIVSATKQGERGKEALCWCAKSRRSFFDVCDSNSQRRTSLERFLESASRESVSAARPLRGPFIYLACSARRHEAVRKMLAQRSLMQFCLLLMVIFSTSEIASVIAGI